jgi:hypothetical protein
MTVNLEIRAAFNERRLLLSELVTLASICSDLRAQFSPGDDWTDKDERISTQLFEMENVLIAKATAVSIAATRHEQLFQESLPD